MSELFSQHKCLVFMDLTTRMLQATVAKKTKPKPKLEDTQNGKPIDLESVLSSLRALWMAADEMDTDLRDDLHSLISDALVKLDHNVRTQINVSNRVRSQHKSEAAQRKMFTDDAVPPLSERFPSPEVRVFVTDLADQALELLPEAARFKDSEEFRQFLVEKLAYNSVSTRKRNAGYLINRFFPGHYLHPDLTNFAAVAGKERLGDVLFYLTARAERILQLVAEKVVWPALPVGNVHRSKMRDFVKGQLNSDNPSKRTTIAVAQCYGKFGIADVSKTKLRISTRISDLATFAYILHLEFPEPGMQPFEKLLDGPMHKWLLWDRQWMIEQLYLCRQEGLLSKVSEIDSMRQFTTKYSLAEAIDKIVKLIRKDAA